MSEVPRRCGDSDPGGQAGRSVAPPSEVREREGRARPLSGPPRGGSGAPTEEVRRGPAAPEDDRGRQAGGARGVLAVPSRCVPRAQARADGLADSGRVPLLPGPASHVAGALPLSGREQDDGDRVPEQGRPRQHAAEALQARHAGVLPDALRPGRLPGVPGRAVRRRPSEGQAVAGRLRGGPLSPGERLRDGRRDTVRRPVAEGLRPRARRDAAVRHDDEARDAGMRRRRQEHVRPAPVRLPRRPLVPRLRRPPGRAVLPGVARRPRRADGGAEDAPEAARDDRRDAAAAPPLRPVPGELAAGGSGDAGPDGNGGGGLRRLGRSEEGRSRVQPVPGALLLQAVQTGNRQGALPPERRDDAAVDAPGTPPPSPPAVTRPSVLQDLWRQLGEGLGGTSVTASGEVDGRRRAAAEEEAVESGDSVDEETEGDGEVAALVGACRSAMPFHLQQLVGEFDRSTPHLMSSYSELMNSKNFCPLLPAEEEDQPVAETHSSMQDDSSVEMGTESESDDDAVFYDAMETVIIS